MNGNAFQHTGLPRLLESRRTLIALVISTIALAACYDPTGPIPEAPLTKAVALAAPTYTQAQVNADVEVVPVEIASKAPRTNGTPPAQCDFVRFLRIKRKTGPADASNADGVLMMMPGFLEGANAFLYMGRQIVYQAYANKGRNFEVWALDRRNNCLEDRSALDFVEQFTDPNQMIETVRSYYYNGGTVGGKKFTGFLTNKDVPYLADFGLKMDIDDMQTIATTMIPNVDIRKKRLFIGGHSEGGPFAALYGGWDFDNNLSTNADAGYKQIAGVFGFDTSTKALAPGGSGDIGQTIGKLFGVQLNKMGESQYDTIVKVLQQAGPRLLPVPGLTPEVLSVTEAVGMLADKAPDQEHDAIRRIPMSADLRLVTKLMYSRDASGFIKPPFLEDYRLTNMAMMGALFDENFSALAFIHVSMGFMHGGSVVPKTFPRPQDASDYLVLGIKPINERSPAAFIGNDAGPSGGQLRRGPLYKWADYSQIGNANKPEYRSTNNSMVYTTAREEMVDPHDFAKTLYEGPSNLTEWYYSTRRLIDIGASAQPYASKKGLLYVHSKAAESALPAIDFVAANRNSRDVVSNVTGNRITIVIPGMEHLDPMMAVANQPDRYQNPVIGRLIQFVEDNRR